MDGWVEDIPAQELLLYRCHALAGVINETTKTPWRQFKWRDMFPRHPGHQARDLGNFSGNLHPRATALQQKEKRIHRPPSVTRPVLPGLWPRVTRSYEPIPPPTPIVSSDSIFPILSTLPSSKTTISTHSLTPDFKQAHPRWLCQYVTHTHTFVPPPRFSLTVPFNPISRDQSLTRFFPQNRSRNKAVFHAILPLHMYPSKRYNSDWERRGFAAHTISQRIRMLKKIPPELIPLGIVIG